jgi:hypothetical protein
MLSTIANDAAAGKVWLFQNGKLEMTGNAEIMRRVTNRLLICLGTIFAVCVLIVIGYRVYGLAIPGVVLPIAFGIVGGFISIQRRLKQLGPQDLELIATSWAYAVLPPFVGGLLAVVLYCFFIAGLIQGAMFPAFGVDNAAVTGLASLFEASAKSYSDYGKLVVWSFLAGFAETFVTDILGVYAKKAGGQE